MGLTAGDSSTAGAMPIGAELIDGGVRFRVWAPRCNRVVAVGVDTSAPVAASVPAAKWSLELSSQGGGYFEGNLPGGLAGLRYGFLCDDNPQPFPDPASRFQPLGPHGPSEVIDPRSFHWTDKSWSGVKRTGQVLYELHIGTFTPEGTWAAAQEKLPYLKHLGITVLEVMPVADFGGEFGWGYDGVNLFAPTRLYGRPDDFRSFVDLAHSLGLGVILDVVYNHFGPDGNYLHAFSGDYLTDRHANDWGEAINYTDENSGPVREFFLSNVAYWIREFHLDGLRFDATQDIHDESSPHILTEMSAAARTAAKPRSIFLVSENEPQQFRQLQPPGDGGHDMDAVWNDDFHHSAAVALTGHNEAYYSDYLGKPQEFVSALKWGYLYQGQWYQWQKKPRGTSTRSCGPSRFVTFLSNHDQVANLAYGQRLHQMAHPGLHRALIALNLLGPCTPMLFQGDEFGAKSPWSYFAGHQGELANLVADGRRKFLCQFPSVSSPDVLSRIPPPESPATFHRCRLNWAECEANPPMLQMHRDLLNLRRNDPVLSTQISRDDKTYDGAVLSEHAFLLRYFAEDGLDRMLVVNFGRDMVLSPAPEPLLASPAGMTWKLLWSSNDPEYGGLGTPLLKRQGAWFLPGKCTVFLGPEKESNP